MTTLATWIQTARPKTLLVSVAPVLMGGALAYRAGGFHAGAFTAALLGAICIQVGTNYANDYFDDRKGADTADRLGPKRALQLGVVSSQQMRRAFLMAFGLAAFFGSYLVWRCGWPIIGIGLSSIIAGILYTATRFSLAYLGIADLFVLLFFGPIAVAGTFYVQTLQWSFVAAVAGLAPGFLATGLLVVNNLRDMQQDRLVGKKTLAVRMGKTFAQSEYLLLMVLALAIPIALMVLKLASPRVLLTSLCIVPGMSLVRRVYTYTDPSVLNTVLAGTGKMTLLFAVLFSVGIVW